ncbi:MAG: hypothetical protein RIR97_391 [Pseudomonadota bacterium]|jgi:tRNA(fMet)-specific endonuclease VapC
MTYLLDSNVVIAVLKGNRGVIEKLESLAVRDVAISALVVHELYYGAYKSQRRTDNLAVLDRLQFQVLDFDREDAVCAGQIRADLALMGKPIGAYDVLIAGQALNRGMTLVTRNIGEFSRVDGLTLENWDNE